jgi:hypothetical protein
MRAASGRRVLEGAHPGVVDLLILYGATPPSVSEIEKRMRPGQWSSGGFLGPHESLESVIAQDAETLKRLRVSCGQIAAALNQVLVGNARRE